MSHLAHAVRELCLRLPDAVGWSSWTAGRARRGPGIHQKRGKPLACRMMPAASGCAVRLSPERECTDCARHGDVLHYSNRGDEQQPGERRHSSLSRTARFRPRDRRRRCARGQSLGGRDALPARAERIPPPRPLQGDRAQLRDRPGVRWPLPLALRRHQPDRGRAGVHRLDSGRHPLARLRLGRASLFRFRLLPPALRLGRTPDQGRQGLRRRPLRRQDPRAPRHPHRAGQEQPLARPFDR